MKQETRRKRKKKGSALLAVLLSGVLAVQTGFPVYAGEDAALLTEEAPGTETGAEAAVMLSAEAPVEAVTENLTEAPVEAAEDTSTPKTPGGETTGQQSGEKTEAPTVIQTEVSADAAAPETAPEEPGTQEVETPETTGTQEGETPGTAPEDPGTQEGETPETSPETTGTQKVETPGTDTEVFDAPETENGEPITEAPTTEEIGDSTELAASVTVTGNQTQTEYYKTIYEAFSAASAAGSETVITLLQDCRVDDCIMVSGGQLTLDLNGYAVSADSYSSSYYNQILMLENCRMTLWDGSSGQTGSITNAGGCSIYVAEGASLVMEGGSVEGGYGTSGISASNGISVAYGGSLTVSGGRIAGGYGGDVDGSVTITAGTITGALYALLENNKAADITLTGGTYTGGFRTGNTIFAEMLETGYGYYNETDGSWITENLDAAGTLAEDAVVTVKQLPVQITGQPSGLSLPYGYESSEAVLKVTAEKMDAAAGEVTYQWYRAGSGEDGADEKLTDSENGYSGSQTDTLVLPESWKKGGMSGSFYCIVSCGGYSVAQEAGRKRTLRPEEY